MSLRERLKDFNLGMSRKSVSLSPHTPNWSLAFSVADDLIKDRIPSDLDLHHSVSTSIPSIQAKPILDILGVVPSIEGFASRQSDLEALGFVWKGEHGIQTRRYCVLYDESGEFGLIHLHVFKKSDREVEKHLVFRDYLKSSLEASTRYERLKVELADAHRIARTNYSKGKSELIAQLLNEAYEWRKLNIARHETGHAVMALRYGQRIQKVSLRVTDSPSGTDKYRAFMKLEPSDPTNNLTGEQAIKKIKISLAGYSSEILFYDVANISGDDLTIAAQNTQDMLKVDGFKKWVATLPIPAPSPLHMIRDPLIRAYIDHKKGEWIELLSQIQACDPDSCRIIVQERKAIGS